MAARCLVVPLVVILLTSAAPAVALGESVTAAGVVAMGEARDGEQVVLEGEALGESLRARGGAWVNVLSGGTAVGVWMTAEQAAQVETFGDYKHRGSWLLVTGEYHYACDQHGGDLDVHAAEVSVIDLGAHVDHPFRWIKAAVGLTALSIALWQFQALRAQRRRRTGA